jgi:hypothetical protein
MAFVFSLTVFLLSGLTTESSAPSSELASLAGTIANEWGDLLTRQQVANAKSTLEGHASSSHTASHTTGVEYTVAMTDRRAPVRPFPVEPSDVVFLILCTSVSDFYLRNAIGGMDTWAKDFPNVFYALENNSMTDELIRSRGNCTTSHGGSEINCDGKPIVRVPCETSGIGTPPCCKAQCLIKWVLCCNATHCDMMCCGVHV